MSRSSEPRAPVVIFIGLLVGGWGWAASGFWWCLVIAFAAVLAIEGAEMLWREQRDRMRSMVERAMEQEQRRQKESYYGGRPWRR